MTALPTTLDVTVHKSHLVTIGERLYGEAIELLRELVNNAYDADATEVHVTIMPEQVSVADNGYGMDLEGLRQYFNIGSPVKRLHRTSPRFGRQRIGEFGIGKFASLAAARRFEVWTKQGPFQATVRFDKTAWEEAGESWSLPLQIEPIDPMRPDGTRVTLEGLIKAFDPSEAEQRLIESVPIQAPHFAVYLNGRRLSTRPLVGHHIPFLESTPYGAVHGEIVLLPASQAESCQMGIMCRVREVLVRRELFELASWGAVATRVTGEAHADFLPLTSDRSDFIRDSAEWEAFRAVMASVLSQVQQVVGKLLDVKENRRTSRVLTEVLEGVRQALMRNPEACPEGILPIGGEAASQGPVATAAMRPRERQESSQRRASGPQTPVKTRRPKRPQVKRLSPSALIKRLKLGQHGLSCCVDHLGPTGPECYTEGTVVYLNRDHPLHRRFSQDRQAYTLYLARLLSQEITLMKQPRSARQAFERQSKLLRDTLALDE